MDCTESILAEGKLWCIHLERNNNWGYFGDWCCLVLFNGMKDAPDKCNVFKINMGCVSLKKGTN